MANPKGWTAREVQHRDKVAEQLMSKGYTQHQAFAISTSQIIKKKKKGEKK